MSGDHNAHQKPCEALRLADALEDAWIGFEIDEVDRQAATELRKLHEENRKLKTVMIAAAEEIDKHWKSHCDHEGYGPVNLMNRLERGIATEYGYTAGRFRRLEQLNRELLDALKYHQDQTRPIERTNLVIARVEGKS